MTETEVRPRIVIAVTSDISLRLLSGFPEYLQSQGWDVHVVSAPGQFLTEFASRTSVSVHGLPMRRNPSPSHDVASLRKWVDLVRRVRPDVVFAGTPKAALLGMLSSALCRVPVRIYHVRGLRMETARGVGRAVLWAVERLTTATATQCLSVSDSLRDRMVELRLAHAKNLVVLGHGSSNGIDTNAAVAWRDQPRVRLSWPDGHGETEPPVVGFIGRISPDKGVDFLVDACRLMATRGLRFRLLVVGGVEGMGAKALFQPLRDLGLDVVLTGHVENPLAYYAHIDILCLPTLREGFPNVVLEAGANGVPVVTTDATGAKDSVADGVTGYVVPVRSHTALADALAKLVSDRGLRETMGSAGTRWVGEHFERRDVWNRTAEFLSSQLRAH